MPKYQIVLSNSFDPYRNLAMEESLFLHAAGSVTLFLWQNQNTVVIGKNQCAYTECRLDLLTAEGGKLARRTSGGGAVYHDLGNLNFTFLADRTHYDVQKQLSVIIEACNAFGVEAEATGRNDLTLKNGGEKFSGNAFRVGAEAAYQHGTLLVNVDMDRLGRYLAPPKEKYRSKGVDSVRARVKNLSACNPAVTVPALREALIHAFVKTYGFAEVLPDAFLEEAEIGRIREIFASDNWRLGRVEKYDAELGARFSFGQADFLFRLSAGRVSDLTVYSDAMDPSLPEKLMILLRGQPFTAEALSARLNQLNAPEAQELADYFGKQTL